MKINSGFRALETQLPAEFTVLCHLLLVSLLLERVSYVVVDRGRIVVQFICCTTLRGRAGCERITLTPSRYRRARCRCRVAGVRCSSAHQPESRITAA